MSIQNHFKFKVILVDMFMEIFKYYSKKKYIKIIYNVENSS